MDWPHRSCGFARTLCGTYIKKLKFKIQIKIQGEELRAEGKKRDDLQEAITAIKAIDIGLPIEFVNFRD